MSERTEKDYGKEKYNGWEDPAWRDYWGMNDEDEPEEIEEQ